MDKLEWSPLPVPPQVDGDNAKSAKSITIDLGDEVIWITGTLARIIQRAAYNSGTTTREFVHKAIDEGTVGAS